MVSRAWLFIAVALVLLATLPPQPDWPSSGVQFFSSLQPQSAGGWFDVAQNVALYAPLGFVLAARGRSALSAALAAAALSLTTELLQFRIPGRSPAARDVLVNTLGALLAYYGGRTLIGRAGERALFALEDWFRRARSTDRRHASRLTFQWALVVTGALFATGALLAPYPVDSRWWVVAPHLDRGPAPLSIGGNGFTGLIDEVRIFNRARTTDEILSAMLVPAADLSSAAPGAVAAFGFDSQGGAGARDDTGNGHDGAVRGASWTRDGRVGGALAFDGRSSEVIVPYAPDLDLRDGMTLEAWVLPAADPNGEPAIISRAGSLYYIEESSEAGPFRVAGGGRFGGVWRSARLLRPIPPDAWTHLAATYDGQALRLYVNGSLAATKVHWSPHRPRRATLNGLELPPGSVADLEKARAHFIGTVDLELVVECGPVSDTVAPVFLIEAHQETEVLALNARGTDIVIRPWTRARRLHLASPPIVVTGALKACGVGERASLTIDGPLQNPRALRDGTTLAARIPGLGSGWAFVLHGDLLPVWLQVAATVIWLAMFTTPIACWARPTPLAVAGVALIATGWAAAPYLLHVRHIDAVEAAGVMAGVVVGAACRRRAAGATASS